MTFRPPGKAGVVNIQEVTQMSQFLPKGVMLNAYPDSIGRNLADIVNLLKRPELEGAFSLFYILPTFFNSDLDRGFSIIDYDLNNELVSTADLDELEKLNILFKLILVLNHLSVGSPQFQDLLQRGDESEFRHFFIDWNEFWDSHGEMGTDGYLIPKEECLRKLFTRKPGLPVLKVRFPDGSDRFYWNTFYQEINYSEITPEDLEHIDGLTPDEITAIVAIVNDALKTHKDPNAIDLGDLSHHAESVLSVVERKRTYLGQMDLNARSELVWDFYDATFRKLHEYGATLIRLDAFAYLHKQPGMSNFFNKPDTWEYLEKLRRMAEKHDLILLPEIHAEYGKGLHEEIAAAGFPIYDFFFPGLLIDALDRGTNAHLLRWINELVDRKIQTVNMLGCHDGIPVLDLKGNGTGGEGLLSDAQIDAVIRNILDRGGRVKNLFGPDGKKISYYQVNATFYSALVEDDRKLRLARAIQMFMPGIPQVWYLDLFAGKNDYAAADNGGTAGHKEINRTQLSLRDVEHGLQQSVVLDQLQLIRLRNTSPAFDGELEIGRTDERQLHLTWRNGGEAATLKADLRDHGFTVTRSDPSGEEQTWTYA